jgi:hypothetical protein
MLLIIDVVDEILMLVLKQVLRVALCTFLNKGSAKSVCIEIILSCNIAQGTHK